VSTKVNVIKPLVLLFSLIFILSAFTVVHALGVTATVPVGKAPVCGAYDSGMGEVFVTNGQDDTVSVISDSTHTVVATINVGSYPYGVAYDSGKGEIFVANAVSNTVSVISGASGASDSTGSVDWTIWIIVIVVIIILLILLLLIWYSRQRKLKVTVQNSQTLSPISGATVSASGPQDLSGITDGNGQIVFSDVKKGDYSIKASATGYNTSTPLSVSVKKKTDCVIKLNSTSAGGLKGKESGDGSEDEGKDSSRNSNVVAQESHNQTQPTSTLQQAPVQSAADTTQTTSSPPRKEEPSEQEGWSGERIQKIIQTFREKGAISPETALTAKELGLSRIFVRIIERRKGQT
jgi:YVTN family beta-propeller protein